MYYHATSTLSTASPKPPRLMRAIEKLEEVYESGKNRGWRSRLARCLQRARGMYKRMTMQVVANGSGIGKPKLTAEP